MRWLNLTEYKSLSNEAKAASLKKVYDAYYGYAKARVLGIQGESKAIQLLVATNGQLGLSRIMVGVNALSSIQATAKFTRKELVLEQIKKMSGYSKTEKLLLVYLLGFNLNDSSKVTLRNYLANNGSTIKDAEELLK